MRILFVTNRFPGQLMRGDQLRAWQQLRCLAPRHEITLLSFEPAPEPARLQALESVCARVITVRRSKLAMLGHGMKALLRRRPLQVGIHDAIPASLDLPALLQESSFDLVHLQLARLEGLLPLLTALPCVLDLVDALSLNMARRVRLDRGPIAWLAASEANTLARLERELCARVAQACVCSEADRLAIGAPSNLHVIDNGVDLEAFACLPPETRARAARPTLVFVGNLGYFPNIEAIGWFAEAVLPLLSARVPGLRLQLVGARPAAAIHKLAARHAAIELIGEVAAVQPWLHAADLAIVPLRAGSGQQLKLLEAMASGTPVVASRQSAEAIGAVNDQHLLSAESAADMAGAIVRLLADRALQQQLAVQARTLVEQRFSWERSAGLLEQLWIKAGLQ